MSRVKAIGSLATVGQVLQPGGATEPEDTKADNINATWPLHLDAGVTLPVPMQPRIGAEINYAPAMAIVMLNREINAEAPLASCSPRTIFISGTWTECPGRIC